MFAIRRLYSGGKPLRMLASLTIESSGFIQRPLASFSTIGISRPIATSAAVDDDDFADDEEVSTEKRGKTDAMKKSFTREEIEAGGNKPASDFPLHPKLQARLVEEGFTTLFPVQYRSLDIALSGQDIMGRSPTGSGKTLAFALPIVHKLTEKNIPKGKRSPLALCMAPTRELAVQVAKEFEKLAPWLTVVSVYGGAAFGPQERSLYSGCDVVVGTPGRIQDHINRNTLDLSKIEFAVLDEADEMLRTGFAEAVEQIYQSLPAKRQNVLWSATIPEWVRTMSSSWLKNPVFLDLVGGHSNSVRIPETVKHYAVTASNVHKTEILAAVIREFGKDGRTLIFTQTKREADKLSQDPLVVRAGALHGDMSQAVRESTLDSFRSGNIRTLIATDVAARGLDIPNVELVIHYTLPDQSESFVHRSGRTGRAGKTGTNVVLFSRGGERELEMLSKRMKFDINYIAAPTPSGLLTSSRAEAMATKIQGTPASLVTSFTKAADSLAKAMGPTEALAAALAHMAGAVDGHAIGYSLLYGDKNKATVMLHKQGLSGVAPAERIVQEHLPEFTSAAHRIVHVDGGAVFDLPVEVANALVEKDSKTFSIPSTLPAISNQGTTFSSGMDRRDGYRNSRSSGGSSGGYSRGGDRGGSSSGGYRGGNSYSGSSSSRGGSSGGSGGYRGGDRGDGGRSSGSGAYRGGDRDNNTRGGGSFERSRSSFDRGSTDRKTEGGGSRSSGSSNDWGW